MPHCFKWFALSWDDHELGRFPATSRWWQQHLRYRVVSSWSWSCLWRRSSANRDTAASRGIVLLSASAWGFGKWEEGLYLMCIGLNHNGLPLFSFDNEPWSLLSKSSLVRPENPDFGMEVASQAKHYSISPVPRPSNWTRAQIMEWLEQNTVREHKDSLPTKCPDFGLCWKEPSSKRLNHSLLLVLVVWVGRSGEEVFLILES